MVLFKAYRSEYMTRTTLHEVVSMLRYTEAYGGNMILRQRYNEDIGEWYVTIVPKVEFYV